MAEVPKTSKIEENLLANQIHCKGEFAGLKRGKKQIFILTISKNYIKIFPLFLEHVIAAAFYQLMIPLKEV